jgi:outer membrane protein OmpA-like peptidoglycan-associated protein
VEGHADRSEGKGAGKLSELRAEAVRDAATLPFDDSRTEKARARNRRVEFRVLKADTRSE